MVLISYDNVGILTNKAEMSVILVIQSLWVHRQVFIHCIYKLIPGHEGHEKSQCEQWRDSMLAASSPHGPRPSPSFYLPQCETDGTFSPVQCHGDAGYCWCVNEDGSEIPGTRSPHGTELPCEYILLLHCVICIILGHLSGIDAKNGK